MRQQLILVVGALAACTPENVIHDLVPTISVTPNPLDFQEVGPPNTKTDQLYISNAGTGFLQVTGVQEGDDAFRVDPIDLELGAGEEAQINVTFAPPDQQYHAFDGRVVLTTNDDDHPTVVVPLKGVGADLPMPDLVVEPGRTVVAPDVIPYSTQQMSFQVHNEGDADLVFTEGSWIETLSPTGVFATFIEVYNGDPENPMTLKPGEFSFFVVDYTPIGLGGDWAIVHIPSNDPYEPETQVLLLGNGGGDWDPPVAVIDCPSEVDIAGPQYVTLNGANSYDPQDFLPLEYQWTDIGRPGGSDGKRLDPDDENHVDYYVDIAGDYGVRLVVTNLFDTPSEPAECWFSAKPADAIHVELTWSTPTGDVDLHLTEGGFEVFDIPEDCSYCNPNPEWGDNGADDDPRLDIDDRGGYGPENINIFAPVDGTYDVNVHYFRADGVPTTATVKVWLDGDLEGEFSQILQNDDLWKVGTIDWTAGTFYVSADPITSPAGHCN